MAGEMTEQAQDPRTMKGPHSIRVLKADRLSPFVEIGAPGLKRAGGFVQEEFVNILQGQRGMRIYREMIDNCSIIGAGLLAIKQMIRKATWDVEPFDREDPDDVERAELVEAMFHDMSCSFEDMLSEILTMIPYGFAPMEIVYKRRDGAKRTPGESSRFDDGMVGWRKIVLRAQDSVEQWSFDDGIDGDGGLEGLWQSAPPKYNRVFIPLEKMLLFQTESNKGNPEGRSALRSCYFDWVIVKRLIELSAIGIERDTTGIPLIKAPSAVVNGTNAQQLADTKAIGENLRQDEQACVLLPSEVDPETKTPMWGMELLASPGAKQFDIKAFIERHEQRIAMVLWFVDWLLIGHEGTGSRALADPKIEMFLSSLDATMDSIAEVFTRHAFPRLWALNGWPMDRMPKMTHSSVSPTDIDAAAKVLDALTKAGADIMPDESLVRHMYGLARFPTDGRDALLASIESTGVDPNTPKELRPGYVDPNVPANPDDPNQAEPDPNNPNGDDPEPETPTDGAEDEPAEKAAYQPRSRRGSFSPTTGSTVRALDLLAGRQRVGSGDSVSHGFPIADNPPISPKQEYKAEIDSAVIEHVDIASLKATQPNVRRDRVRAFLENPMIVPPGKRNMSGTLEDMPVVFRDDMGSYIQDGHHRLAAAKLMGQKGYSVRMVDMPKVNG